MPTYSYSCSRSADRQVDTEREFVDPPDLAGKYFFERPAILELRDALKPGDVVRMAFQEVVPLGNALCVLGDWHSRLRVLIEFTGSELKPHQRTWRALIESGAEFEHALNVFREAQETWKREDDYELACN